MTMYYSNFFIYIQITKESVVSDRTLLTKFREAVNSLHPPIDEDMLKHVHGMLLAKMYNTRCNEFLWSITKLSCIKNNKAVDVNIGLRDQLKCYAAKKEVVNVDCN